MRIVGIVAVIVAMMVGVGSNIAAFIDAKSLIIVVGGTIGMLLLGGSRIPLMVSAIFAVPASEDDARTAARGWKMARMYALASGVIGSVIGWVIMLKNLDDPAAIGPGMAIALLSAMFAVALAFFLALPCQTNAEKGFPAADDGSAMTTGVLSILFVTIVSLSTFGVLVVSLK